MKVFHFLEAQNFSSSIGHRQCFEFHEGCQNLTIPYISSCSTVLACVKIVTIVTYMKLYSNHDMEIYKSVCREPCLMLVMP